MTSEEKILAFVEELNALCDRHDIHVTRFVRRKPLDGVRMVGSVQFGGPQHFTYEATDNGRLKESVNSDYMTNFPVEDDP